jgi:hypothetical protein
MSRLAFSLCLAVGLFPCHLHAEYLPNRELRRPESNALQSTLMTELLLRDLAAKMLRNEISLLYFQNR